MPLYISDYIGDTMHLTTEQHGAYLLLLMAAWRRGGHVPDDPAQLAQIARMSVDRWQSHAAAIVLPMFTHRDGMFWHKRVEAEIEAAKANVHKKSRAGAAGAAARWQNDGSSIAIAKRTQSQTDAPSPLPIPKEEPPPPPHSTPRDRRDVRFAEFWNAWPKNERKQDKAKCGDHWKRNGFDAIADAILADVATKRKTQKWAEGFIEAPLVYLRGKRWEDGVQAAPASQAGVGRPAGVTEALDWRASWKTIVAKGVEIGVGEWKEGDPTPFPAYRAKVEARVFEIENGEADAEGQARIASIVGGLARRSA